MYLVILKGIKYQEEQVALTLEADYKAEIIVLYQHILKMTTYKHINSTVPVPLTARVYADNVEIHIFHKLAACLHYQWFFDDLLGGGAVEITGAIAKEYQVDLTSVASSGEYYCEIKIGMTGCNDQVTERRRVSIIECLDQTDRTFAATGASGQVRVNAPHYETVAFSNEGNNWILADGATTCATMNVNVCTFVQEFTLVDQITSANSARRGQPSLTVGGLVCFFNIGQDFIRTVAPTPPPIVGPTPFVVPDPPPGPSLVLTQSGPVFTDSNVVLHAHLSYTLLPGQTAPVIPDGNGEQVVFTVDDGLGFQDRNDVTLASRREFEDLLSWQQQFTRHTAQTRVVTGTYTDPNGNTVSNSITVVFETRAALPTIFMGGTPSALLDWLTVPGSGPFAIFPTPGRLSKRQNRVSFQFAGGGLWEMSITIHPWGVTPVRPTQDRPVKLAMAQTRGGANSTDGGTDWDDLGTVHGLTFTSTGLGQGFNSATNPLMEAPVGGGVIQQTFKFQGIGNINGILSLNATDNLGYDANTDDMNITVIVEIRPQT